MNKSSTITFTLPKMAGRTVFGGWPGNEDDIFCLVKCDRKWSIYMREMPSKERGTSGIMLLMLDFPDEELAQSYLDRLIDAVEYWKAVGLI